jgi:hypothetical protein
MKYFFLLQESRCLCMLHMNPSRFKFIKIKFLALKFPKLSFQILKTIVNQKIKILGPV